MPRARASLIGRSRELAALNETFDEVRGGARRTVVIGGEAGIGKTRLATEFLGVLPDDVLVLRGQCADSGGGPVPYAALTDLVRSLADVVGRQALIDGAGPAAGLLGRLWPGLVEAPADGDRHGIPDLVADLLAARASERPLVVLLEDLHWSDDATRALVVRLARRTAEAPLLVLLTVRTDDVGPRHVLRSLLAELERARLARRLDLGRLAQGEARRMVRALADAGERGDVDVDRVVERSGGVPFYIEELASVARDELPDSLRAILLVRYEELTGDARAFCRAVAAGGISVPHDLVSSVLADAPASDTAIREAVDARLLQADASGFTFRHALVREAVYGELLPGERRDLHAAYARALEQQSESVAGLARVADHWWRAHDLERALGAAVRGMRAARAAFAASTAVQLGERALDLWDRLEAPERVVGVTHAALLYEVADLVREDTRPDRARELAWQAYEEWPRHDVAGRAELLGGLARMSAMAGRDDGPAFVERALELLPPGEHPAIRAELLLERTRSTLRAGRDEEGLGHARAALTAAGDSGDEQYVSRALSYQATALARLGDPGAAVVFEAAREAAGDDWRAQVVYYTTLADVLLLSGAFADAARVAREGAARARELRAGRGARLALENTLAEAQRALGEWSSGPALLARWLDVVGEDTYTTHLRVDHAWLLLWMGDVEGAESVAASWRATWERHARTQLQVRSRMSGVLGQLALIRGDPDEALRQVSWVLDDDPRPSPPYVLPLLFIAAHAVADLRTRGRAADDLPYREVLVRCSDWPTFAVWSALFAAQLGEGTWSAVMDLPGAAIHRPYALYRDGADLIEAGDRLGARDRLTAALTEARAIGAGLVADRAAALLDRAGLTRPPDRGQGAADGPETLTAREEQVLALVADGLTNKQIGERLFISPKTVSVHVSAVLRKLGAATRTEAATRRRA
ncbi:helix-turn-helix transcriptional regulator [Jiangella endophytica]|uniref:helix-turn-helix transcriptional regulator n=1 Tax=Jiangella endophytica TaxID=1623398 RepID=UPI0018E58718|nr:AAA family ATPase [Jiangella endophytica]